MKYPCDEIYLFVACKLNYSVFALLLLVLISGEFDELICALRTGEVFGEELAKLKQTRRRRPSGTKLNGTKEMTRERTGKIIRA